MTQAVVAIVPARGGSSRIPRKNVKDFNGQPIVRWPLAACREVDSIAQIVVSTDDAEIAQIARDSGVTSVIDRPAKLATGLAGTAPVITHAIDHLELADDTLVMCLYPTATISSVILDQALELAHNNPDDFVVTVGRHRSPHERSLERVGEGLMALTSKDHLLTRTQDLPQRFFDAGKLYIAGASVWRARETMMAAPFVPYYLPDWAAVDIDEPDDWSVAEALHRVFVLESS